MPVYVDRLLDHGWILRGHPQKSCHMYADTLEELHAMALAIGMKASWFQGPPKHANLPHYDLTTSRRAEAVRLGAVEHCRHRMVNFMRTNGHPSLRDRGPLSLEHPCCHEPQASKAETGSQVPSMHAKSAREQQEVEADPAAS